MRVEEALSEAVQRLSNISESASGKRISIENPRLEAEVLLAQILGWERWQLLARGKNTLASGHYERFTSLIGRRLKGEPVAYIIGEKEFWSRKFHVSEATLVPRPETELIIETAIDLLSSNDLPGRRLILDLGTGSGIIAITLALEIPGSVVVASDLSFSALETASGNVDRYHNEIHAVGSQVHLVCSNWLAGVKKQPLFDMIVSNPPYVAEDDISGISADILDFEPPGALFSGRDGLDAIRFLVESVPGFLKPGGWFLCEFGAGQGRAVFEMAARGRDFEECSIKRDLAGVDRMLAACR